jgi:hypothetical protein
LRRHGSIIPPLHPRPGGRSPWCAGRKVHRRRCRHHCQPNYTSDSPANSRKARRPRDAEQTSYVPHVGRGSTRPLGSPPSDIACLGRASPLRLHADEGPRQPWRQGSRGPRTRPAVPAPGAAQRTRCVQQRASPAA